MNFRTMLQPNGNQEFLKIMQREVDVINTDNTVCDPQNDQEMNPLSSGRPQRAKDRTDPPPIIEKMGLKVGRSIRRNPTAESLSTAGTEKLLEKVVQMEAKYRGMELRLAGVEAKVAQPCEALHLKARVEALEKALMDLRQSQAGKGGKAEGSRGQKSRELRRDGSFQQPKRPDHLSEAISTLKSKLEYRNTLLKTLSKPEN